MGRGVRSVWRERGRVNERVNWEVNQLASRLAAA